MAEQELKNTILERVQEEKEAILKQARQEADNILKSAEAAAFGLRQGYLKEVQRDYLFKKAKELSLITQGIKKGLQTAKEEKISNVFDELKDGLRLVCKDRNRYRAIFSELLNECLDGLGHANEIKLKVNPQDEGLASECIKKLQLDAELELDSSVDAGLIVSDLDENTAVANTFSSRLGRLESQLRQELSRMLFDE